MGNYWDKDAYIAHASEQKSTVVAGLVSALRTAGLSVWLDSEQIPAGRSVVGGMEEGITRSRFAILVVSNAFLRKHWTKKEREAFEAAEGARGYEVIIPVAYRISIETIRQTAPFLATKRLLFWKDGLDTIVAEILARVRPHQRSQRQARLESLTGSRSFRLHETQVRAIRLVGADDELFTPDDLEVSFSDEPYVVPSQLEPYRTSILDRLESRALADGRVFFNGTVARLLEHHIVVVDVREEKKRLTARLGPLTYFDYSFIRALTDEMLEDDRYPLEVDEFVDLRDIVSSLSTKSNTLPNITDTATTVLTLDGIFTYSHRSGTVQDRDSWFTSTVAETVSVAKDYEGPTAPLVSLPIPFRTVIRGIAEELSPSLADMVRGKWLNRLVCTGLSFDLDGFGADFLFLLVLPITYSELIHVCLTRPGKDFIEGTIVGTSVSSNFRAIVETIQSNLWTPGGAASVVRAIEAVSAIRRSRRFRTTEVAVNRLANEGFY